MSVKIDRPLRAVATRPDLIERGRSDEVRHGASLSPRGHPRNPLCSCTCDIVQVSYFAVQIWRKGRSLPGSGAY